MFTNNGQSAANVLQIVCINNKVYILIGIYKITNKTNGKIYIGQSVNIKNRIYDHLYRKDDNIHGILDAEVRKIGSDNFEWEILEECNKDKLNEREMYYIGLYNSTNPNIGYNIKIGGSPILNGKERKVIDITTNEIYISTSECARQLNLSQGDIVRNCNHYYGQVSGHIFMYHDEYLKNGIYEYVPVENHGQKKKIKCIDLDTTYESCHEAARQLGLNFRLISLVCNGKRLTTGGYKFCYV